MTQKIWLCRSGEVTRNVTISSDVLKRGFLQVLHVILCSKALKYSYILCAHGYLLAIIVLDIESPFDEGLVTFV